MEHNPQKEKIKMSSETVVPVPPNDRLVLELLGPVEEKTAGGIYLAGGALDGNDAVLRYRVVQVGPGLWSTDGLRRCPVMYGIGDVVLCNKPPDFREYAWGGRNLTVLNEADVLGGYREGGVATGSYPSASYTTLRKTVYKSEQEFLENPTGRITLVDGDPTKAIIAVAEALIAENQPPNT